MESQQLSASISEINAHNELLQVFFNSIVENVYELLIQNESNSNIHDSDIEPCNLKICQDHSQENLPNLISLRHYNYHDLKLIKSNWRNCHGFNIPLICKFIENKLIEIPPPFVVLKMDAPQLEKYLDDDVIIDNSFANMQLIFELNDRHKIKVCKYKKLNYYYIIIFFDSLNYNDTYVFSNHNVIKNLNDYDVEKINKKSNNWFKRWF
jgi:hypothetical protein